MKKLFYLASGIILCASFLPKEVNARDRPGLLLRGKEAKEAKARIGSAGASETCKNKSIYELYESKESKESVVIGKKFGRVFKSPKDAEMFFKAICRSSNPVKMMKSGVIQEAKAKKIPNQCLNESAAPMLYSIEEKNGTFRILSTMPSQTRPYFFPGGMFFKDIEAASDMFDRLCEGRL